MWNIRCRSLAFCLAGSIALLVFEARAAFGDAVKLKNWQIYAGKVVSLSNKEIVFDVECKGKQQKIAWVPQNFVVFGNGCSRPEWEATGGDPCDEWGELRLKSLAWEIWTEKEGRGTSSVLTKEISLLPSGEISILVVGESAPKTRSRDDLFIYLHDLRKCR